MYSHIALGRCLIYDTNTNNNIIVHRHRIADEDENIIQRFGFYNDLKLVRRVNKC